MGRNLLRWILLIAVAVVLPSNIPTAAYAGDDQIYPVLKEPHHITVFHNAKVNVYEAHMQPHVKTFYHTHTDDQVSVTMRSAVAGSQVLDKPEITSTLIRGAVSYTPYSVLGPITHRVLTKDDEFWVIAIAIPPSRDRTAKPQGLASDQQILTIPQGSVQRVDIAPNTTSTISGSMIVAMSAGKLSVGREGAWEFSEGSLRWIEGNLEQPYRNAGPEPVSLIVLSLTE